jgi:hypothetical protein
MSVMNYNVRIYQKGEGVQSTTYVVSKEGNSFEIYINAYTEEGAIARYEKFMN